MRTRVTGTVDIETVEQCRADHPVITDPERAWERSREEERPVLAVFSAPQWCYWCRVHESKRSLYADRVWDRIVEEYVPLVLDAEQYPEHFRMLGAGGWPTTASFDPSGRCRGAFTGPRRPGPFIDWLEERPRQGETVSHTPPEQGFEARLADRRDPVHGGIGRGPKRPAPGLLGVLLDRGEEAFVERTVDAMTTSALEDYRCTDPIEGGVHRYAADRDWSHPHFEKLIDDAAGMVMVRSRLGKDTDSLERFLREMVLPAGGFAASEGPYRLQEYFGSRERDGAPHRDERFLPYRNARAAWFLFRAASREWGDEEIEELAITALERLCDRDELGLMAGAWTTATAVMARERGYRVSVPAIRGPATYGFAVQEPMSFFGPERALLGEDGVPELGDIERDWVIAVDGT